MCRMPGCLRKKQGVANGPSSIPLAQFENTRSEEEPNRKRLVFKVFPQKLSNVLVFKVFPWYLGCWIVQASSWDYCGLKQWFFFDFLDIFANRVL